MIFFSHGGGGGYNLSENDWYFPGLGTLFYLLSFFKRHTLFFFFPSDFKLKIFIVFHFSSQVLTQPQKGKAVHSQFRDSPTFNYISELEASDWVDQHPLPTSPACDTDNMSSTLEGYHIKPYWKTILMLCLHTLGARLEVYDFRVPQIPSFQTFLLLICLNIYVRPPPLELWGEILE